MENNYSQKLFIKLFKPIIKLSEKLNFQEKTILVGNTISKLDPILLSLIDNNISFILENNSFLYHKLEPFIFDLKNGDYSDVRKAFVDTLEQRKICIFPLNENNCLEDNNYLKFLNIMKNMRIVPFFISGSYKPRNQLRLETGNSFLVSDYQKELSKKVNGEIKKLIR